MKRVVVALAGDADPARLADAAADVAHDLDAQVTVVSVDEVESQRFESRPRSEMLSDATRRADVVVERLAAHGVAATSVVRGGTAGDVVCEVASEVSADLIVVGASHRPALAQRLLGSLAMDLIRRADRQVLVVSDA